MARTTVVVTEALLYYLSLGSILLIYWMIGVLQLVFQSQSIRAIKFIIVGFHIYIYKVVDAYIIYNET